MSFKSNYFGVSNLKIFFTFVIFIFSFFGFYHGDFIHTSINSTFSNNNLYEMCEGCHYFPLIYWIFYLWGIPLQLISSRTHSDPMAFIIGLEIDPLFFLYHKLLLVIIFFVSIYLTFKISKILKFDQPKLPAIIFAFSPFSFFVIFIYSGYDIFSLFFILLAIFLFLKKKIFWSFFAFSISLSFKFFSIVVALSLLALLKDKLVKKFGFGLLLMSFLVFQFILFCNDPNFIDSITYNLKRHSSNNNISFNPSLFAAAGFIFWLFLLQFSLKVKNLFNGKNIIFIPYIAILFLYFYSPIAPPWIILCLPFIYLVVVKNKHEKLFLLLEIIFFIIFCILISNVWIRNIDLSIGNYGIYNFLHNPSFLYKDFYVDLKNNNLLFFIGFCLLYLFLVMPLILIFYRDSNKLIKWNIYQIIYYRFTISTVFFLIPFVVSPFLDQSNNFSKSLNSSRQYIYSYYRHDLYNLKSSNSICELVHIPYNNLDFIGMRIPFDYDLRYADIQFIVYHKKYTLVVDEIFFDNKSIFLKIPAYISDISEPIQFCINNNSDADINFFVNSIDTKFQLMNGFKTFVDRNLPLYFYFNKP